MLNALATLAFVHTGAIRTGLVPRDPGTLTLFGMPASYALNGMGFPRFGGGVGGFVRFVAICPPDTKRGVSIGELPESPLQRYDTPLHWDPALGMRVR